MLCQSFPFEWVLKIDDVIFVDFTVGTFRLRCPVSLHLGDLKTNIWSQVACCRKKKKNVDIKDKKRAIILKFAFSPVTNSPNYKLMTVCLVQEMGQ